MKTKIFGFTVAFLSLSAVVGIAVPVLVTALAGRPQADSSLGAAYAAVVGLLLAIVIVKTVAIFKIDDSTFHTALIAGCLFAMYALSSDMDLFLESFGVDIPPYAFGISGELAFSLAEACCCWYILFLYRIPLQSKNAAIVAVTVMAALMGYSLAVIFGYGYIFHFLLSVIFAVSQVLARGVVRPMPS